MSGRNELERHQLERLRMLVAEIAQENAFYAPRLRAAGLTGPPASLADFVGRMPFTTKDELVADQDAHAPYGTNLTAPLDAYVRVHQTSGTRGMPLRWLDTERNWDWLVDGWHAVLAASDVTPDDRVFFAFSFGPFLGLWLAFAAAQRMGCLCIPGGGLPSATRARAIVANGATVLCCTPTYAARLGEVAAAEGIDLGSGAVRAIVVGGEPGASIPAVRAKVERLWPGARLFDHHGMTEAGSVTHACAARPGVLHVLESAYLCEIADPRTGAPLPDDADEPGELVLTTLGRFDSPVLRYRTGDLVRARRGGCACGLTTLRFEGGVLGRVDDMIIVRGVNLYPSAVDRIVQAVAGVAEYRVEVYSERSMAEIRIKVEVEAQRTSADEVCAGVARGLREAYNLAVHVEPVGELPRFELKAERWVRT